jgi:hypothetical protein
VSIDSRLVRTIVVLAAVLAARPALAPPPPMIPSAPGTELTRNESYWLAPYTLFTNLEIGSFRENRVRWFTPDGKLEHEIQDVYVGGNPGFVERHDASGTTFTSVANPRWEIYLPAGKDSDAGPSGWIGWSADGRVFVRSSRVSESYEEWPRIPTTIEMFVEGKRKTLGPYRGGPRAICLDAGGALAVHFLDGRLALEDSNGHERFQITVPVSPGEWLLGCNDYGVLITDTNNARPIEYYGVEGARSTFANPDGYPRLWIARDRVLFETTTDSLVLVDCIRGRKIWTSPYEGERVISGSQAYAVVDPYLITAAVEVGRSSQSVWPVIRLRALELKTGQAVASWDGNRAGAAQPRFFTREGKVLFLDGSRLSAVNPDDIRENRQGWISAHPPTPPSQFEDGPAASPLSWKPAGSRKQAAFAPRQRIARVDRRPVSVDFVHFRDARPYGEKGNRDVWLARYDSVRVPIDSTRTFVLEHLSAAFDATTGNLVCAFTDAAPRWLKSKLKPVDAEARARESRHSQLAPAAYASLQSTPGDILGALLGQWRIDLSTVGQIVLRPRFVTAQFPARRFEGKLTPAIPPSNAWIVEVLGTKADPEYGLATLVAEFRDDTRKMIEAQPMP